MARTRRYMHGKRRRKTPLKVDLTKKEGLGPREKETDTVRYEMGNPLGFENPVAREKVYEKTESPIRQGTWKGMPKTKGSQGTIPTLDEKNQKIVSAVTDAIVPDNAFQAMGMLGGAGVIGALRRGGSRLYSAGRFFEKLEGGISSAWSK